jgi:6-phosphogluconate dehydrogenase
MNTFDFGIIGLGVMGRNLLLNMADQKFAVAGLDLDEESFSLTHEANPQHRIKATIDVKEFVGLIKTATGNYVTCASWKACRYGYLKAYYPT